LAGKPAVGLGLVSGQVVENDVDLLFCRSAGHYRAEESDELFAGVTGHRLGQPTSELRVDEAGQRVARRVKVTLGGVRAEPGG
jgi:hypothetical protein